MTILPTQHRNCTEDSEGVQRYRACRHDGWRRVVDGRAGVGAFEHLLATSDDELTLICWSRGGGNFVHPEIRDVVGDILWEREHGGAE